MPVQAIPTPQPRGGTVGQVFATHPCRTSLCHGLVHLIKAVYSRTGPQVVWWRRPSTPRWPFLVRPIGSQSGEKPVGGDMYYQIYRCGGVIAYVYSSGDLIAAVGLCQRPMRDCFSLSSHPQSCLTALRSTFIECRLRPGTRDNIGRGIHMIVSCAMIHLICPC